MNDYRERLLYELIDLESKITKLEVILTSPGDIEKEIQELMAEQLDTMIHYKEILIKRIIMSWR